MHIDSPQIVNYGKPNAKLEHHRQSFSIFQPSHIAPFRGWPRLELSLPSRPAVLPLLPVLSLLPAVLALALPAATSPGRMRPRVKRVAVRHGTPWQAGGFQGWTKGETLAEADGLGKGLSWFPLGNRWLNGKRAGKAMLEDFKIC